METRIYPTNFGDKELALYLQQKIAGYGFQPTGEQLINYLKSEERGFRGDLCIIPTLENVYDIDPWDLPAKFNEQSIIPSNDQEWWFICPQPQNRGISRKTPCGSSWKITGKPNDIKPRNEDRKIGFKKTLVFPSDGPTNWVIHEYHLFNNHSDGYYVLCHLMDKRDEMVIWRLHIDQPDDEESFSEDLIQAKMNSLREIIVRPSAMDFTGNNGLTDEYILLGWCETKEEVKGVGYQLNGHLIDAGYFQRGQMQTLDGQISVTENRQTRTIGSLHGADPIEQKKGVIQSQVSSTKSSTNPPRPNLVNVLVGIFLLFAITRQVFNL